jgi:hypothetical protein
LRRRLGDARRRTVERESAADCVAGRWEGLIDEVVTEAEGREARAGTRSDGGRSGGSRSSAPSSLLGVRCA